MAIEAPVEEVAYVAAPRDDGNPDAMCVVDLNTASDTYGQIVHKLELGVRDEIHHFGWNACSAALCPYAPHPYIERRYLVVPALRGSSIYILDVKEDPKAPKLVKTLTADEVEDRSGYTRHIQYTAVPKGSTLVLWLQPVRKKDPAVYSSWITTTSISWDSGRWNAVRNPSLTISGGIWAMISLLPVSGDIRQ